MIPVSVTNSRRMKHQMSFSLLLLFSGDGKRGYTVLLLYEIIRFTLRIAKRISSAKPSSPIWNSSAMIQILIYVMRNQNNECTRSEKRNTPKQHENCA